ncbi:MAG: M91 family zinc metallopeptidase [Almyronema sp.]
MPHRASKRHPATAAAVIKKPQLGHQASAATLDLAANPFESSPFNHAEPNYFAATAPFASRPFAPVNRQTSAPNVQAQLAQARTMGFDPMRLSVFPEGSSPLITPEWPRKGQQKGGAMMRSSPSIEAKAQTTETPTASVGNVMIQPMSFTRFSGFWGSFKSYNDQETTLLDLEKRTGEALDGMRGYHNHDQYGERLQNLAQQFTQLTSGTYEESQYESILKSLKTVYYATDKISTQIAAQDLEDEKALNSLIAGSFEVVDSPSEATRPNQITQDKLVEITALLNDIYFANESNLVIAPDMSYGTYDLAKRSAELGESIPPEVLVLELKIRKMETQRELIQKEFDQAFDEKIRLETSIKQKSKALESLDPEKDALDLQVANQVIEKEKKALEVASQQLAQARSRRDELDEATQEPQKEYNALVKRIIKKETMKDLVKIAQTGVGRDLLKAIAKTSLETSAKKVTINAYSQYKNPTAAESKGTQNPYVDYTPQYFKNRDTQERQEGGAIRQFEALKAHNPWQENERTDITLFHELVHTYHFQSGESEKNDLISDEDAVHGVDRPYGSEDDRRGVREEEYATVGLGKYSDDKYTENAYRNERRRMGELVSPRDMYTHKDEEGNRAT